MIFDTNDTSFSRFLEEMDKDLALRKQERQEMRQERKKRHRRKKKTNQWRN